MKKGSRDGDLARERFNRWQGLAIAQLSVAVALISGLSVAGLSVGLTLIRDEKFMHGLALKSAFASAMLFLLLAAFCSCATVVTRVLDFHLTARKVRKEMDSGYDRSLTMFWLGPRAYGLFTWGLFGLSCLSFAGGAVLLVISVGTTYALFF